MGFSRFFRWMRRGSSREIKHYDHPGRPGCRRRVASRSAPDGAAKRSRLPLRGLEPVELVFEVFEFLAGFGELSLGGEARAVGEVLSGGGDEGFARRGIATDGVATDGLARDGIASAKGPAASADRSPVRGDVYH